MTNESGFDELIDVETVDPERVRCGCGTARNLLLQAGVPPGLTPRRQTGRDRVETRLCCPVRCPNDCRDALDFMRFAWLNDAGGGT